MKTKKLFLTVALLSPLCCLAEGTTGSQPGAVETVVALLPAIFFVLILIFIAAKIFGGSGGYSTLLSEKDPSVKPVADNNNGGNTTQPKSVSRFIALLTGLVALTIGIGPGNRSNTLWH